MEFRRVLFRSEQLGQRIDPAHRRPRLVGFPGGDRGFADAQFGGQLGLGDAALAAQPLKPRAEALFARRRFGGLGQLATDRAAKLRRAERRRSDRATETAAIEPPARPDHLDRGGPRSEEHTSELQSLMRISYAVFCLKKKKQLTNS